MSCANKVALTGGAKDTSPPVLLKSNPPNQSVSFSGKRLELFFDEFIQLRNANQKLIVSPPLNNQPKLTVKGKALIVAFDEDLKPNTTYSLNFDDGICDLNEANPLKNFVFSFSTGDYIDSLTVSGRVIDAYSSLPVSEKLIFLYDNFEDSLPYKSKPYYITRSNDNGKFVFKNLKDGKYKLFALSDKNSNLIYDNPDESIAFTNSIIIPYVNRIELTDTVNNDSLIIKTREILEYGPDTLLLYSFKEDLKRQFVKTAEWKSYNMLEIIFNRNMPCKPNVNFISNIPEKIYSKFSNNNDSLIIWFKDSLISLSADSLKFDLLYCKKDSLDNWVDISEKISVKPYKSLRKEPITSRIKFWFNISNNALIKPHDKLVINAELPIKIIDEEKINLYRIEQDSVFTNINYILLSDSLNPLKYNIKASFNELEKYKLVIDSAGVMDIAGNANDSMWVALAVSSQDNYGLLKLTFDNVPDNALFVLFDEGDKLIKKWKYDESTKVKTIKWLNVGKYKLMCIIDENNSNEWESGIYLLNKQPETIIRYDNEIIIRANWDLELLWDFSENSD